MFEWLITRLLKRATTLSARQRELAESGLTPDELIRRAYQLESGGQRDRAAALYRKALSRQPKNPDALYLLGDIHRKKGEFEAALPLLEQAIQLNPTETAYYAALADLHQTQGNLNSAESTLRQAIAIRPGSAPLVSKLGSVFLLQHRFDEAHDALARALALDPNLFQACYNTGLAYREQHKLEEAAAALEHALRMRPDFGSGYLELGEIYLALDQLDKAREALGKAFEQGLDNTESQERRHDAHVHFANLLLDAGKVDPAIHHYRCALQITPNEFLVWANLGNAYKAIDRFVEAGDSYLKAISLNPQCAHTFCNMGLLVKDIQDCARARSLYEKVREIEPAACATLDPDDAYCEYRIALCWVEYAVALDASFGNFHYNRGVLLEDLGQHQEALACFEKAVELAPSLAEARFSRGLSLLRFGRLEEGWKDFEARLEMHSNNVRFEHLRAAPMWSGAPLPAGTTLLMHAEQGLGDTIHFIRYLPLVLARCQNVIVEVQPGAKALIAAMPGAPRVFAVGETLPPFDFQVPFMSLPRLLGTRTDTIPQDIPYLFAASEKAEAWKAKLAPFHGLKVGLVWAGGAAYGGDRFRSASLATFAPLANCPNVVFFSLQKGEAEKEMDHVPPGLKLVNTSPDQENFLDTAALIANLDLVITVDTSVLHLAGAMGKPTWVPMSFCPDWRWIHGRDDSLWYPTVRIFRQTSLGNWGECIARVKSALINMAESWDSPSSNHVEH